MAISRTSHVSAVDCCKTQCSQLHSCSDAAWFSYLVDSLLAHEQPQSMPSAQHSGFGCWPQQCTPCAFLHVVICADHRVKCPCCIQVLLEDGLKKMISVVSSCCAHAKAKLVRLQGLRGMFSSPASCTLSWCNEYKDYIVVQLPVDFQAQQMCLLVTVGICYKHP